MPSILLQRAGVPGRAEPTDVRLDNGVITAVGSLEPTARDDVSDLQGYVLSPAAVEPHAHLDKVFLAERITNPTGDLMGAIGAMQANRHLLDVAETIERAERAARRMAHNGYRMVRTHADCTQEHGLRSIEALAEVRRRVSDLIDIQIVALCGWPVVGPAGATHRVLLADALAGGADLVGGCPHLEPGGDVRRATEWFCQVATDHGVGLDLHTDESLDPDVLGLLDLLHAIESGFALPTTASHCVTLGLQDGVRQQEIAALVAAAGVGIVALPHTNLYLQGRGHAPMPRGLTAVAALRSAGVPLAAGADNVQDPFNPLGRLDPLETAGLMVLAGHLLPGAAWDTVTTDAARVVGATEVTVTPDSTADLVAVRAATLREAIAFGPPDRIVWRHGVRLEPGDGTDGVA